MANLDLQVSNRALNSRCLEIFVCVAENLSFTRAAVILSMTQPAVTFQIRQMEEALGGQVFTRAHNAVQLTDLGLQLLEFGKDQIRRASEFKKKNQMKEDEKFKHYKLKDLKINATARALDLYRKTISDEALLSMIENSGTKFYYNGNIVPDANYGQKITPTVAKNK